MEKKKILWLDIETTGLDPTLHSAIEIAGIVDIDGKAVLEFDYFVKPHPDFEIDDYALQVNKISRDKMKKFPEISITHAQLKDMMGKYVDPYDKRDKFVIAGQNISFDLDFLSHFFMRQGDSYLGSFIDFRNRIELMDITRGLKALGFIENVKLEAVCKELNVNINAHNALSDIKATRELYYKIKENVNFFRE